MIWGYEVARPNSNLRVIDAKSVPIEARVLRERSGTYFVYCTYSRMYYAYILKLRDNTFYVGFSSNLKQRIQEHSSGMVAHTKHFLPCILSFYAAFTSKKKALEFERYLKTSSGFAFRNKHLV